MLDTTKSRPLPQNQSHMIPVSQELTRAEFTKATLSSKMRAG